MTLPTDKEIREAAQKDSVKESELMYRWPGCEHIFEEKFLAGAEFILSSLRQPAEGDESAADNYTAINARPFDNGGLLFGRRQAFLAGCAHARAQSQAEIASLKAECAEYRAALGKYIKGDDRFGVHIARDVLAQFPEREG